LLAIEDLRTTFSTPQGPLRATDGVSFVVERGRTLGIVGESGSGKTVLTRSIMGLLPTQGVERSGSVRLMGRELVGLGRRELAKIWGDRVAVVFQDPMTSLNPVIRIGRQLTDGLHSHRRVSRSDARDQAIELLRSVGTPDPDRRVRQYPHELSGGLRQRVTIAMALSSNPDLLLADEPTTALDVTVQSQILDLLARAQAERQMGMILVTHDLGVVAGRTDEIAVMYAGRIVERAPTRSLFANPRMPYTEALMASIPRATDVPHSSLPTIPGRPPSLDRLPSGCAFAPRCTYATERCRSERPPLRSDQAGHDYACWFPIGSASPANQHSPAPSSVAARLSGVSGARAGTKPTAGPMGNGS
jgi:oligopeptide/dipeptide ABC transporter ATP-binding protein